MNHSVPTRRLSVEEESNDGLALLTYVRHAGGPGVSLADQLIRGIQGAGIAKMPSDPIKLKDGLERALLEASRSSRSEQDSGKKASGKESPQRARDLRNPLLPIPRNRPTSIPAAVFYTLTSCDPNLLPSDRSRLVRYLRNAVDEAATLIAESANPAGPDDDSGEAGYALAPSSSVRTRRRMEHERLRKLGSPAILFLLEVARHHLIIGSPDERGSAILSPLIGVLPINGLPVFGTPDPTFGQRTSLDIVSTQGQRQRYEWERVDAFAFRPKPPSTKS